MANRYDVGDGVRLTAAFTVDGTATDPTTVTCKVEDPSGNEATYTYALAQVVKDSTGNYHYDLSLDESGLWHYRWAGTGTVIAAGEGALWCKPSQF